ncbi:MAG: Uncharacterised protein [Hyphomonas sp. TMED17]|nr:MAG: Uncharacterised protein [Hyphomonas sp. TMED17]
MMRRDNHLLSWSAIVVACRKQRCCETSDYRASTMCAMDMCGQVKICASDLYIARFVLEKMLLLSVFAGGSRSSGDRRLADLSVPHHGAISLFGF